MINKCPNDNSKLVQKTENIIGDPKFFKKFNYLICSKCGYELRVTKKV